MKLLKKRLALLKSKSIGEQGRHSVRWRVRRKRGARRKRTRRVRCDLISVLIYEAI
jgi:hypothetical protein